MWCGSREAAKRRLEEMRFGGGTLPALPLARGELLYSGTCWSTLITLIRPALDRPCEVRGSLPPPSSRPALSLALRPPLSRPRPPAGMPTAKCTRRGCGHAFDPDHNDSAACSFHPGAPGPSRLPPHPGPHPQAKLTMTPTRAQFSTRASRAGAAARPSTSVSSSPSRRRLVEPLRNAHRRRRADSLHLSRTHSRDRL